MSVVLDIILLSVIVFCIVSYYRKGFAASAVGFARFIIAAGLSFALSGLVADLISSSVEKTVGEDNASYIAYALAFVLVFAAAMVLLGFAERFLGGFISSFPILGTVVSLFGGGVGLLVGFLFATLLVELYAALAIYVGGVFSTEALNDSVLAEFLYEYNLFVLIFKSLS